MIGKVSRLLTVYGATQTIHHVCRGANLTTMMIQGTEADVIDMFADAAAFRRKYAARHIIIAPAEPMSITDMCELLDQYGAEFCLDMTRAVIVAHQKKRADPTKFDWHLHALVRDFDAVTGGVADNRQNFRRQEKLQRLCEIKQGHAILLGKHHAWVIKTLRREGNTAAADAIEAAHPIDAPRPKEGLSAPVIQHLARMGISAPHCRQRLREAWRTTTTEAEFRERLAMHGMTVVPGDRERVVWVVMVQGTFLCSLAGGLPGVGHPEIVRRLGVPTNGHSAENTTAESPTAAGRGEHADDPRQPQAARREDRPPGGIATAEPGRSSGDGAGSGSAAHDPAGHAEGDQRAEDPARSGDRVHQDPAAAGWSVGDLIRLTARRAALDENARLARLAAEPPRTRVDRLIGEIEGDALGGQVAAEMSLPDPPGLSRAKAITARATERNKVLSMTRSAAEEALQEHTDSGASLFGYGRYKSEDGRLTAVLEKADAAHRLAYDDLLRARKFEGMIQSGFDKSERDRHARAEPYRRRLRLVHEARSMLARAPRLAAYGAPYIMAAARRKLAINPQAKDIWGVPLTPPDAVI